MEYNTEDSDLNITTEDEIKDQKFESDFLDLLFKDLYNECIKRRIKAKRRSGIYKILYIILTFIIVITGAIIGILSIDGMINNNNFIYYVTILGFLVSIIESFLAAFEIQKRSLELKKIAIKLSALSRKTAFLKFSDISLEEKIKNLNKIYTKLDELDISIINSKIMNKSLISMYNSKKSEKKKRSISDEINLENKNDFDI